MQILYLFVFKNRNSQDALGMGYVTGNSSTTVTGQTNQSGMCGNSGDATDGKHQVKCLGIEDFWGNASQWCDGVFADSSYIIWTDYNNFTSTNPQNNYRYSQDSGLSGSVGGTTQNIQGTNNGGFIVKTTKSFADYTKSWADYGVLGSSYFCNVGGYYRSGTQAGAFYSFINRGATNTDDSLAARMVYKSKR